MDPTMRMALGNFFKENAYPFSYLKQFTLTINQMFVRFVTHF